MVLNFNHIENLKELIEFSPDGILLVNDHQKIIALNSEAKRIFGFDGTDIETIRLKDLFFSANDFLDQHLFKRNLQTGKAFEIYARRANDSSVLVNLKIKNFKEAGVNILSVRDLTNVYELERNKLAVIVSSSEDAIISKDLSGKILSWNKGAENLFQYKASEVIGKHISVIIPPEKMYEEELILEHIKEEIPEKIETYRKRKDGSLVDVSVTISPLKNKSGKIIGAAKIARDITEQVRMINRLQNQNKRLEEFSQIVAHNFRSPINNMESLLYFYKIEKDSAARDLYVSKLNDCVQGLNETFEDLLNILYLQYEEQKQLELVNFNNVFHKILANCENEIKETNATIVSDFSAAPEFFYLNSYLESIMQNLISNAIKYRHPERNPIIQVTTEKNQNQVSLLVSDNGLGINLKRYGSKLFGFHKTFHEHPQAKGVGLYLVKMQVEAMGGKILVESKINTGTTFKVIF